MHNFFTKVAQFMYGRYGMDKLNIGLLILWLAVNILNTVFFRNWIVQLVTYLIVALIIFRCLSKNIEQRKRENDVFMFWCCKAKPLFIKIKDWFKLQGRKFADRKTHRYIKCPYCKATIRVPFSKGKHTVKCPRCSEDFKTNIRF